MKASTIAICALAAIFIVGTTMVDAKPMPTPGNPADDKAKAQYRKDIQKSLDDIHARQNDITKKLKYYESQVKTPTTSTEISKLKMSLPSCQRAKRTFNTISTPINKHTAKL
ncbi:hypothetical protein BDF19DRAFT_419046 [Syncephalis fuscata]|nr:hypothetical protein BDF19DRAFT_419342 [Syncephalis fuscata]KAI9599487.1 hypothetical protein BDF19DRAFT_419046 [Syncephalis fuscata]